MKTEYSAQDTRNREVAGRLVNGRGNVLGVFVWGSKSMDNMTSDELIKALEQTLKTTERETQIKVFRAIMRNQNIDGLDLEEVLERELKL
jgi:hypothetical protein